MAITTSNKQVYIRVDLGLYHALAAIARQERRSIPQAARLLLEESLQRRMSGAAHRDDISGLEIAAIADAGSSFRWLEAEPDLYNDNCGEPV